MLERVLEPEVMDSAEDAAEYAGIDNASVNDEFVTAALGLSPEMGRVLDIGAGPGDIAISIAKRAPGLRVTAIDLGEHMLGLARKNVASSGVGHRVEILQADAKQTGFDARSFDVIVSNSLVHHIPEPLEFFREVQRLARPGAALYVKDLHRPETTAELEGLVWTYARDCSQYQRRLFWDSLNAALTTSEVLAMCRQLGMHDVTVRRCSDRHWCLERPARSQVVIAEASPA
jgi:ubiquinone/menaquinone biosynthesis C-methylase UbiE